MRAVNLFYWPKVGLPENLLKKTHRAAATDTELRCFFKDGLFPASLFLSFHLFLNYNWWKKWSIQLMGLWTTDLLFGKHPLYRLSHQLCRIADTLSLQGLECVLFLAWFVRRTTASWISFKLWNSFTFLRLKQIWYGAREERGPSLSTVLEHSRQKNNRWLKLLLWGYWSVFLIMGAGNTDVLKLFILHFFN